MKAAAFVVGPRDGVGAALAELARTIGFSPVEPYRGLARAEKQAEATPLLFFLCAAVDDIRTLKPMADAIRFSPSRKLRFAPLIYFTRDPSVDCIRNCIQMGFDDVIALPFSAGGLELRIARQVGQMHVYYETETYFGPDRRNRINDARSSDSDHGGGQFRRIEIIRHPDTGIDVLKDDMQVVL